jgi:hypothetical protein
LNAEHLKATKNEMFPKKFVKLERELQTLKHFSKKKHEQKTFYYFSVALAIFPGPKISFISY